MAGAEKAISDQEIHLGGKVRRLVANHWALAQMEVASGKSAMTGELFKNVGFNTVTVMLWALLLKDPEVKRVTQRDGIPAALEYVSEWIEMDQLDRILTLCSEAISRVKGLPTLAETEGDETGGKEQTANTTPAVVPNPPAAGGTG